MNRIATWAFGIALICGLTSFAILYQFNHRIIYWDSIGLIGQRTVKELAANHTDRLYLWLISQRKDLSPRLSCFFGWQSRKNPCEKNELVNIDWELTENGNIIASGNSRTNNGYSYDRRIIGNFSVIAGHQYRLTLQAQAPVSPLLEIDPKLVAMPSLLEEEGVIVKSQLLGYVSFISFCVGIVSLIKYWKRQP